MKCLSAAEGGAAWHGDCAIFSRWWSAPAAPAVGVRGSIPRVGPRGIACLTETPVLRGFSLALMPSPPASRLPPPLPLTRTEGLATATTPEHSAGLAELMLGLPRNTGKVFAVCDPKKNCLELHWADPTDESHVCRFAHGPRKKKADRGVRGRIALT